jgi:hypothetical protein
MTSSEMRLAPISSFAGSAERIWPLTRHDNPWLRYVLIIPGVVLLIVAAWLVVAGYYLVMYGIFGFLFLPWRIVRRGNRKRKIERTRHEEVLAALRHHGVSE